MTTATAVLADVDRWGRLVRRTGIVGLITVGMLFALIVAISTLGEPPFTATAEQARAFFTNGSVGWPQLVTVVLNLAAIGLIWFLVGLALLLARAKGKPPWRSGVALVSGVMLVAYLLLDVSWDAASDGLTSTWRWQASPSMSATSASRISGWRWAASRPAAVG